jgi:alkylation response protein AidB-like acyl-CoA dehydrogenase
MVMPTGAEMIARARSLAPALAARAVECEALRRCPDATIADFRKLELHRALQPSAYGGCGLGWDVLVEMAIELGRGYASQAWVLSIYGDHAQWLGTFPREAQDDVWRADSDALVCTCYAPMGRARAVDGGFVVSGRWSFASGIDHATWLNAGAMLDGRHVMLLAPKSDARIVDDWDVAGLAGTGSKTFVFDDVFVPAHRMLEERDFGEGHGPGGRANREPVYRYPRRSTADLAGVLVGAALGLLDEFIALNADRAKRGRRASAEDVTQLTIAETAAELDCARWLIVDSTRTMMDIVARGERASTERRVVNRRNQAAATQMAVRAAERLFAAAGGNSLYATGRMQRLFRDIHAGASHFSLSFDYAAAPYGQYRMGAELPVAAF